VRLDGGRTGVMAQSGWMNASARMISRVDREQHKGD
jgi:hypothetical protein